MARTSPAKYILPALFDIRPVTKAGDLDLERIKKVEATLNLKDSKPLLPDTSDIRQDDDSLSDQILPVPGIVGEAAAGLDRTLDRARILEELEAIERDDNALTEIYPAKEKPVSKRQGISRNFHRALPKKTPAKSFTAKPFAARSRVSHSIPLADDFYFPEVAARRSKSPVASLFSSAPPTISFRPKRQPFFRRMPKPLLGFMIAGCLTILIVPGAVWVSRGLGIKNEVLANSLAAYESLLAARQSIEEADWHSAEANFGLAHFDFVEAEQEIQKLGDVALNILERLPGGTLVSSGAHLIKAGEHLAVVGQSLAATAGLFSFNSVFDVIDASAFAKAPADKPDDGQPVFTDQVIAAQGSLAEALAAARSAGAELDQVEPESLPADIQDGVISLQQKLPLLEEMLDYALNYSHTFLEFLGHHNSRRYLLLFQNNSELRATGGFVGTYGLLTLDQGEIKQLFVDGIFNADGQLHEKIVPPQPIQKISTAWSMHDANWFADFPTSARKIAWFYEKTGGATVDGVITFTPIIVERLLHITGPIAMPEYDINLDADNFVELIQYKVEEDYDKELNRPKQILADFAPKFIEALGSLPADQKKLAANALFQSLAEKHILMYFNDTELEDMVAQEGWGGELIATDGDYFSVVSSNINGFKTDRVIEEKIDHAARIQNDGSITVMLTVARKHTGGHLDYDWWNQVNANYLRVYLPRGTELISARGHTLEIHSAPIDYEQSGFKVDPLIRSIEDSLVVDQKTGIHIFEESGKTVFGAWTYVSPGETTVLTYTYRLPFNIDLSKPTDSYSLVAQKQSGSVGSKFTHSLEFPAGWQVSWKHPEEMRLAPGQLLFDSDLQTDKFLGTAFATQP